MDLNTCLMGNNTQKSTEVKEIEDKIVAYCIHGQVEMLNNILIENKYPVNYTFKYVYTFDTVPIISYAAQFGKVSIVKYLVEKGADINLVDKNNETPLHWAVDRYKALFPVDKKNEKIFNTVKPETVEIIKILLENRIDKYVKDKWGLTALDWAKEFGDEELINLLFNDDDRKRFEEEEQERKRNEEERKRLEEERKRKEDEDRELKRKQLKEELEREELEIEEKRKHRELEIQKRIEEEHKKHEEARIKYREEWEKKIKRRRRNY